MDLTPSQPSPAEDEPLGEQPPARTAEPEPGAAQAEADPPTGTGTTSRVGKEIGGKKFRVGTGDDYVPFRSRTKRRRRMIASGTVGLVLLGAAAYGVVSLVGSPSQTSTASGCAANAHVAAAAARPADARLPTAGQIKLNVYNSTN